MHASMPQPERLGQFEIVDTLALGATGPIYLAFDPLSQRSVVLKTIPKTLLESYGTTAAARFQNEARAAACLKHPGILEVYGYGEDAGLAFVVMEYVEGSGLKAPVPVPLPDAVSLVTQLLEALDYAHDRGVVHLDIQPARLLLTSSGDLRITGFGVARFDSGTPHYMSPEQFMGLPIDRRSDVFSTGVLFYELLTGVNPFGGPPQDLVDRVCNYKERPPSAINLDLPRLFDPVCAKSLAKAVYDRYPTALAFCDAIRSAFESAFNSPVSRAVSSETVVALTTRASQTEGAAANALSTEGSSVWEESTLRAMERQLAKFIGPLARIIVKEAALRTTDLERLYTVVAESLENEDERKAFLVGRFELIRGGAQSERPRPPLPTCRSVDAAAAPAIEHSSSAERKPAPKADLTSSSRPPVLPPERTRNNKPEVGSGVKPERKPEIMIDPKKRPATASVEPEANASWEALLGEPPDNLAGYLRDKPAQLEEIIHPFVASVEALLAARAANHRNAALVPQSICFDRLGKATIQISQSTAAHGTGSAVGNPRYAVPESFAEKASLDDSTVTAANLYALGFMFYEILLGTKLFEKTFAAQRTELDWLCWHANLEVKAPALKSLLPACPAALSDLMESMMEKHVEKRPADLNAILPRLRSIGLRANSTIVMYKPTSSAKGPAAQPAIPRRKSRKAFAAVLLIITLVLVGIGTFAWQSPDLYRAMISYFQHLKQMY